MLIEIEIEITFVIFSNVTITENIYFNKQLFSIHIIFSAMSIFKFSYYIIQVIFSNYCSKQIFW